MGSGFIKNIMISLAIAVVLVVVVNVIGELAGRPRAELPPPQSRETAEETKGAEPSAPVETKVVEPAPVEKKATQTGIASLLAAYNPEAGKKAFRKCMACHTSNKGGKKRVGPNLWNVVGRDKGTVEGFKYSDAMKLKGGAWTFNDLNRFLANPRTFIIGTKMSIKGFSDPVVRASLIGFLRALSDNPIPLPE